MRKTKRKPLDSALTAAWEKVFAEAAVDDLGALQAQGWLTFQDFCDRSGMSLTGTRAAIKKMVKEGRLENKKIRCHYAGKIREINICRPRI
jgi:hypothetical protein